MAKVSELIVEITSKIHSLIPSSYRNSDYYVDIGINYAQELEVYQICLNLNKCCHLMTLDKALGKISIDEIWIWEADNLVVGLKKCLNDINSLKNSTLDVEFEQSRKSNPGKIILVNQEG